MPSLESLQLCRVIWSYPRIDESGTTYKIRRGDFLHLKDIRTYSCPQHWQLVLLLASSCAPVAITPIPSRHHFTVLETIAKIVMPGCKESVHCTSHEITYHREEHLGDFVCEWSMKCHARNNADLVTQRRCRCVVSLRHSHFAH